MSDTLRSWRVALAVSAALAGESARAVTLGAGGTGEVLIYPYYTVNHQQTLISIVNTAVNAKAVRVRFREGYDGREVAGFNVYLGASDSWVAAVYDTSGDGSGAAAIATSDNSCTVPAFATAFVPGGARGLVFSDANYTTGDYGTPTGIDSGPTDLARTREGFFEVLEMGEIVDRASGTQHTLAAISAIDGKPPAGCAQVQAAWRAGGYWTADSALELLPPAGGLYGSAAIIDVAQGTLYTYDATAIDGFSDVVQHTAPGNARPNLSTAVTDSAHDVASAFVPVGNAMVRADYPASLRGVDAVSAVLAAAGIANDYEVEGALGAATDWVLAFPTKQFYVDPGIVGTAASDVIAPFEELFGGGLVHGSAQDPGEACIELDVEYVDRAGKPPPYVGCGFLCPNPAALPYACFADTIVSFNGNGPYAPNVSLALASALHPVSLQTIGLGYAQTGHVALGLEQEHAMRAASGGATFTGLPVIGFAAINFINASVTPGVLSNYSATQAHRATVSCSNPTQADGACR